MMKKIQFLIVLFLLAGNSFADDTFFSAQIWAKLSCDEAMVELTGEDWRICSTSHSTLSGGTAYYLRHPAGGPVLGWYHFYQGCANPESPGPYDNPVTGECEPCPDGEEPSEDGQSCVPVEEEECDVFPDGTVWCDAGGPNDQPPCIDGDERLEEYCQCNNSGGSWLGNQYTGGTCLPPLPDPPPEEPECAPGVNPYFRFINGVGSCSTDESCGAQETYSFVGGQAVCVPNDLGSPDCNSDTVSWSDGEGWSCEPWSTPEDHEEEPDIDGDGIPDDEDTDMDGDGVPNAVDDDVDGDGTVNESDSSYAGNSSDNSGVVGAIEDLQDLQAATTQEVQNGNVKLDGIGEGIEESNTHLTGIGDGISSLDGYLTTGYDGQIDDETGTWPTIGETSGRIASAVFDQPFIASLMLIPTVPTSTSCPVFVFPANQYWSAITMDVHCTALESVRSGLSSLFIGIWTVIAGIAFLKA